MEFQQRVKNPVSLHYVDEGFLNDEKKKIPLCT